MVVAIDVTTSATMVALPPQGTRMTYPPFPRRPLVAVAARRDVRIGISGCQPPWPPPRSVVAAESWLDLTTFSASTATLQRTFNAKDEAEALARMEVRRRGSRGLG
jgi:hypothetical protein